MTIKFKPFILLFLIITLFCAFALPSMAHSEVSSGDFPRSEESYADEDQTNLLEILAQRIYKEPFNIVALLIFICAIIHTLLSSFFIKLSHKREKLYKGLIEAGKVDKHSHSISAAVFHLLGEVEVVFGIWAIALAIAISAFYSWETFVTYVDSLHYTEPLFIIVIMTIASSRPILKFFEFITWHIVKLFGDRIEVWWFVILTLTPILGSVITEPAAMTIAAMLLSEKFYQLQPTRKLRYATLALLFVNVSIGGSLTNFAAPPILMVAGPWQWTTPFMFNTFGWKALLAIIISTFGYYLVFRKDINALEVDYQHYLYKKKIQSRFVSASELENSFTELAKIVDRSVGFTSELNAYSDILKGNLEDLAMKRLTAQEIEDYDVKNAIDEKFEGIQLDEMKKILPGLLPEEMRPTYRDPNWNTREAAVPAWIISVHVAFLIWTVVNAHDPVLFMSGFLFFLGFFQVTVFYQNRIDLKPALLVAFFIAGLVIHGTLQSWWIGPLLEHLPSTGLNITSIFLTAFNDNAAITYLSTLVPNLPDTMKYAVVSGAITGGGLTVIANAPNPVGQSILKQHFKSGISSVTLFKYALFPTFITFLCFFLTR